MKTIFTLILSFCCFLNLLIGQQDPVKLCAEVNYIGNQALVDVKVEDFTNISSFQFGVAWETSAYNFVAINNLHDEVPASSSQIFDNIPEQISLIRTLWFDQTAVTPISLNDGSVLFTIVLEMLDQNNPGLIGIAPANDFDIEFSNGNVEEVDVSIDGNACSTLAFNALVKTNELFIQEFTIAPNPFTDMLNINLEEKLDGFFTIFSSTGKVIKEKIYADKTMIAIDLSELPSGAYLLKYSSQDNLILGQQKIIKL